MSKWAGKYVIGLTGNIGTGKRVVRKMLEHLGAYSIDADSLGHRVIAQGAPGYKPVINTFGASILGPDKEIDRAKLAKIVFSNPAALAKLEEIVHPIVGMAIDLIIKKVAKSVIVIEAIKLIEADIDQYCDSLWVTYSEPEQQLSRLVRKRKMSILDAKRRIQAQSPQEQKIIKADVVIENTTSFEGIWKQVVTAWQRDIASGIPEQASKPVRKTISIGDVEIIRAKPSHSAEIVDLINRHERTVHVVNKEDIMEAFGEKAFVLLKGPDEVLGVAGWQVENLIARTTDLYIDLKLPLEEVLKMLVNELERLSKELQSEASMIFLPEEMELEGKILISLGYAQQKIENISIPAWKEAARESLEPGFVIYVKQLRLKRVLRPL
ncbi:MAG: dephospho-CoA kinase [Anaerolineaceae bacterium]|nr:dephospho-CoA kinase [Anaerolineaceae bacterium]